MRRGTVKPSSSLRFILQYVISQTIPCSTHLHQPQNVIPVPGGEAPNSKDLQHQELKCMQPEDKAESFSVHINGTH
ncbi:hypothetical protein FOBRF1_006356 [Fusarium oxysporum]